MAAIERTYTIPLRRAFLKAPRYKRAKRAVNEIKYFLEKHMKVDPKNLKISNYINLEIWKHGIRNPPSKIRINVKKDDKGMVTAELVGAPVEAKKEVKKSVAKKESKTEVKKEAPKTEIKIAGKAEEKEDHSVEHKPFPAEAHNKPAAMKKPASRKTENPATLK